MAALRVEGLAKRFGGRVVLGGISLALSQGELVVVLGASGGGKTTLLRLIAGFARADTGTIEIDRMAVTAPGLHEPPERRRIGYVAQEGALFPHLTVAGNIGFGLKRRPDRERRIAELLDTVGLPRNYGKRFPYQLSGGEQQRVALARALAPAPRLMLLDEPFSGLDATLRQEVRQAVVAVLRQAGATALLVTHDQAEALSVGDRVAVLRGGRIVQIADPVSLYRRPRDAALARFVGEAILLPGTAADGVARCSLGSFPVAAGDPDGRVEIMIRPEQVRLVPPGTAGSVRARVGDVVFYGHDAVVQLTLPEMPAARLSARLSSQEAPVPDQPVGVAVAGAVVTYPEQRPRLEAGMEVTRSVSKDAAAFPAASRRQLS